MGQRSQIYVRYKDDKDEIKLIARYFQWNYGHYMLSRARQVVDFIHYNLTEFMHPNIYEFQQKLPIVMDANFDIRSVVVSSDIIKEASKEATTKKEFNNILFHQDNNDGVFLVDVLTDEKKIKYAFLDYDLDINNIMDGNEYMFWNCDSDWKVANECYDEDDISTTEKNIDFISSVAQRMTPNEVKDFLKYDYSHLNPRHKNERPLWSSISDYGIITTKNSSSVRNIGEILSDLLTSNPRLPHDINKDLLSLCDKEINSINIIEATVKVLTGKNFKEIIKEIEKGTVVK